MRRLAVLFVLLGVMVLASALKTNSSGAGDPLTLAAIGFVVLAAFTVAEIGSALSLPRVTGYILAGAVLGPSVTNILSPAVVGEMRMFNTLALGLIATAAGLELDAVQILRRWRTLGATTAIKVVLGGLLVGTVLLGAGQLTGWLGVVDSGQRVALALVFGTLSVGTSPAIALAVSNDLRARGRLTELVLGSAVLKDVVVVIALAAAITVAKSFLGGVEGASETHVLAELAQGLGSSIAMGAVLGGLLIVYLRFVRAEMLLVVAGMILVTAEVARALHLELVLVFITAGFVVRNLSRFEQELMGPVGQVALPVFVVFFTIAGASIDLSATVGVLPLALALVAARGLAFVVASHVGGAVGRESPQIRSLAWLGYLPQAGVTLGLFGVAAHELPTLAPTIQCLGMAVVALNLLVGPVTLRWALRTAGEATTGTGEAVGSAEVPEAGAPAPEEEDLERILAPLPISGLRGAVRRVAREVAGIFEHLIAETIQPWARRTQDDVARVVDGGFEDGPGEPGAFGERSREDELRARAERTSEAYRSIRERLRLLPATLVVPFGDPPPPERAGLRAWARWRWWAFRWRLRLTGRKARSVPLSMMARVAFEPEVAAQCAHLFEQWSRAEVAVLAEVERCALGQRTGAEARVAVEDLLARHLELARADAQRCVRRATARLALALVRAGTPAGALADQWYSRVEPSVRTRIAGLGDAVERWSQLLAAAERTVAVVGRIAAMRQRADTVLLDQIVRPMLDALRGLQAALDRTAHALRYEPSESSPMDEFAGRAERAFPEALWNELEEHTARFRTEIATHRLALELRGAIAQLPEHLAALDPIPARESSDPLAIPAIEVDIRTHAERTLLGELQSALDEEVRAVAQSVVAISNRVHDAHGIVEYALGREAARPERREEEARDGFGRALGLLERQCATLDEFTRSVPDRTRALTTRAMDELQRAVLVPSRTVGFRIGAPPVLQHIRRLAARLVAASRRRLQLVSERLLELASGTIPRELYHRYTKQRFDATEVNEFVNRWRVPASVPDEYAALFSQTPLVGSRFFVEHAGELDALVRAERGWLAGGPSSALVIGPHGSGRTALIDQCKLQLGAPRLLRPQPLQWRRDIGLFPALGVALGVPHDFLDLVRALTTIRTTVLLDDIEHWFVPDPGGLLELERFLELVVRTRKNVFWIVSIDQDTLALLEEVVPVANAFGRVVRLTPSRTADLAKVIETRHRMSGRPLIFKAGLLSRVFERIPALRERDVFFRLLARISSGNLAGALALWLRSIDVDEDGAVWPRMHLALTASLPFVGRLTAEDQALLLLALRFGPLRTRVLARILALPRADAMRRVAFLEAAGLLEQTQAEGPVGIPVAVRPLVVQGLGLMGVSP
ncbi:MAG: cation:proton antiporter [Polyangiaceae bacterium]|nr:cation:proton antiporter [Polyangiaceae bacterium]